MTTKAEKSITIDVPVSTAYNQWTQFEDFPSFMSGVQQVKQLNDRMIHWVAEIAGIKREWDAAILEQVPDRKIAWAATSGATNAGAVFFESLGPATTVVRLSMEYEPEGLTEQIGDKLGLVERQVEADLQRFKAYIEGRGAASGGWRGSIDVGAVGTPGAEDAGFSKGDSGKAGPSAKTVAAGAAAVAGVAAAAATASRSKAEPDTTTADATAESVGETDTRSGMHAGPISTAYDETVPPADYSEEEGPTGEEQRPV
jgi:polyketide cyclase/dehydrase/lipid transport protein